MDKKKLLIRLISLIAFIFLLNLIILKFHWYYSIWWSDMLMHFLGGIWLGTAFLFVSKEEINTKVAFKILLGVLLVSVLWEIFEFILNNFTLKMEFSILDTLSDFLLDLAGGSFVLWRIFFYKDLSLK
jgi:hypothetical protein